MRFIMLVLLAVLFASPIGALTGSSPAQAKQVLKGPFPFQLLRVIDGDTFHARITIWLGQTVDVKVRLKGVDTPELNGKCAAEKKLAQQAKQFTADWLAKHPAQLVNVHYGTYAGRVLATTEITAADMPAQEMKSGGSNAPPKVKTLSAALLSENLAKPYRGRKASWCR
ncbi:MAG: thermonuclease family protein [Parvibaculales bacterium]